MEATHHWTALMLAVAGGFLLFAGGFWLIVSLGQWALAPVERRVSPVRLPSQFSLREFLVLITQAQLAIAAIVWWWGDEAAGALVTIAIIGACLVVAWWQGTQRLSRSGVTCCLRRCIFLALVNPLAGIAITAALWINGTAVLHTCLGKHWPLEPWLIGNLVIIGAFVICRMLTVWAMRDVTPAVSVEVCEDGIHYLS